MMKVTLFLSLTLLLVGVGGATSRAIAPTFPRSTPKHLHAERNAVPSAPTGGLFAPSEDGEARIFPLQHTEVKAKVSGN
ncbi:MAG: hypothetical protein AB4290_29080, partial [Spirulina sp.]